MPIPDRNYLGESIIVTSEVYKQDGYTPDYPVSVSWRSVDPVGTPLFFPTLPLTPTLNQVVILGTASGGFQPDDVVVWNGAAWTKVGVISSFLVENTGTLVLPPGAINQVGMYQTVADFDLGTNVIKSVPHSFTVIDPFNITSSASSDVDQVIDRAWMKLEDLYDSDVGGPYLRDVTKSIFDRDKMARLLPDALYGINNMYQPATGYTESNWPFAQHGPLLSQALLVESIYHLMRSYVEQPNMIQGGQFGYFDRRDYLNRWQTLLQLEETKLDKWLDLFKRDAMGFGQTSTLVGGYASYYGRYPRYMRSRYPFVYRY